MSGTSSARDGNRILVDSGTFAVLVPDGDITGGRPTAPDGLFVRDARHLSRWRLGVAGGALTVLASDEAHAVMVLPGTRDEPSPYTVLRGQAVAAGTLVERLTVVNNLPRAVTAELRLTVDADFADQFELRSDRRRYSKPGSRREVEERADGVVFRYLRPPGWTASTTVIAEPAPRITAVGAEPGEPGSAAREPVCAGTDDGSGTARVLSWRLRVPPHGSARVDLTVEAAAGGSPAPDAAPGTASERGAPTGPDAVRQRLARDAAAFTDAEPRPEEMTGWTGLARAVRQGLADLAGLRVPVTGPAGEALRVPGAGTPWFLTLFGRDSLLTSLFCLPYRPGLAAHTLAALAAAQGTRDDPARLEQPGRIPHELRHGELAHFGQVPYGRYYGSVDATPLFLVLLQAYTEHTGDTSIARRLEQHARAAVAWMFRDGGLDDGGWLVYHSDEQAGGLANQNWKDSAGAVCFADGTQATGAIAVAEAQGYAYDALRRTAHLAENVWGDPVWAQSLRQAALDLRRRFPQEFWLSGADFPALALDGEGRRVDALASDAGHLLWSGMLDQDRAQRVARRLLARDFFSGWGVRTLAADQAPYHPLSYHRGAIWPHDNAIIALGMASHGLVAEAREIAEAMVTAARHNGWRLPEVISGYGRDVHPAPVPYPHSCSPQAWAAATPLALLTATTPAPR
ncbi:Glycogen debranching enzyme (alpha-1,6-glucosidase) [Actinacidiphila yanglinensis]|uniref:Glycogen debranching enzyme (Alpha-1,6-glucosidase) n=1 Tax=Actinacidiphila yanglinensis TaxID=310779 RepID=A0A1H6DPH0_9ACTN|nr:glycogen debranching N-terminal domain-containing protein [Actinacidiphila yanglinensis]SEG87044.1 Glycogen debranching enzyme (alpha-1,6-glucosidase) [Actinacidiphila yanglinensis]